MKEQNSSWLPQERGPIPSPTSLAHLHSTYCSVHKQVSSAAAPVKQKGISPRHCKLGTEPGEAGQHPPWTETPSALLLLELFPDRYYHNCIFRVNKPDSEELETVINAVLVLLQ